jgi:quercetin dioxygenase-like cupin family protein
MDNYPPPTYFGDTGVASATFRPRAMPAGYTTAKGTAGHYLISSELSDGAFTLLRWEMSAKSGGPAPHFHRSFAETFYVLSGSVRMYDGITWRDGEPGDLLHVPAGGIHAFTNASGAPASMLMLLAPGVRREAYFAELATIATSDTALTDEEWADLFARHDTVML